MAAHFQKQKENAVTRHRMRKKLSSMLDKLGNILYTEKTYLLCWDKMKEYKKEESYAEIFRFDFRRSKAGV